MKKTSLFTENICGIDEAGRGPLAGPVFAAAVILPDGFDTTALADSKALTARKREKLAKQIFADCLWGVGSARISEIDAINILQATMLAMKRSFTMLAAHAKLSGVNKGQFRIIVDGNKCPDIPHCIAVVKADRTVPQVMAASIIAKVSRDMLMDYYAAKFPQYGFDKHKGYCTKAHLEAIYRHGPSPIQRKSFRYPREDRL